MDKLFQKSEIVFSIFWIIVYIVGSSVAGQLSKNIGITKSVTLTLHLLMSAVAWWKKFTSMHFRAQCDERIECVCQ